MLTTAFIKDVPKAKRPPGGVTALGRLIGRRHVMPVPAGADRPSGALHHFAEGTLQDELHTVRGRLDPPSNPEFPATVSKASTSFTPKGRGG